MNNNGKQSELSKLVCRLPCHPFRLRVNDCVRIDGKLGRVVRVTECAAVVLVNQPHREFTTRFDKHVEFQPPPKTVRIAANAEIAILNRKTCKRKRHRQHGRRPDCVTA
jgi:hypothetical protein